MLLSKCKVCDSKKSKFINEQEASELLSSLGINTPLNKIALLGLLLFYMPEMHLRQPGFTYSACVPFTKNKERIKKFKHNIEDIFIKMNQIKLVFNMIWHMEILKI